MTRTCLSCRRFVSMISLLDLQNWKFPFRFIACRFVLRSFSSKPSDVFMKAVSRSKLCRGTFFLSFRSSSTNRNDTNSAFFLFSSVYFFLVAFVSLYLSESIRFSTRKTFSSSRFCRFRSTNSFFRILLKQKPTKERKNWLTIFLLRWSIFIQSKDFCFCAKTPLELFPFFPSIFELELFFPA